MLNDWWAGLVYKTYVSAYKSYFVGRIPKNLLNRYVLSRYPQLRWHWNILGSYMSHHVLGFFTVLIPLFPLRVSYDDFCTWHQWEVYARIAQIHGVPFIVSLRTLAVTRQFQASVPQSCCTQGQDKGTLFVLTIPFRISLSTCWSLL